MKLAQIFSRNVTPVSYTHLATEDARLHGAGAALQHFSDFFVAQSFEVAQNHGTAKDFRNLLQRALHRGLNFVRGELLKRCGGEIFDFDRGVPFFGFGVDGNVFL